MNAELVRLARLLTIAVVVGTSIGLSLAFLGVGEALGVVAHPEARDWYAYWDAAERLRAGEPLYPGGIDQNLETTFRYAPWFAVAWIPITYLPRDLAGVLWVLVLLAMAVVALLPLLRSNYLAARMLGALFAPFLAQAVAQGNVQVLLVAALVHGVDARWGPVAVGVAASLKGFPILYAGRYLFLGRWRDFGISIAVTAALLVPILLVDLSHYPLEAGPVGALRSLSPFLWIAVAIVALLAAVRFADSPAGWFTASLALVLGSPRLLMYDLTFLLVTGREILNPRKGIDEPESTVQDASRFEEPR